MHATSWAAAAAGETYERGRPDYPAAAIALLAERLELGPRTRLADVAAGTGKLTRLLAGLGCRQVVAVEPMAGMRAQIARHGAAISLVAAEVEHLPLATGSLDAVTVAQAFHWFDVPRAAVELARVLGPAGRLAIVTNRPAHTTPWQADLWSTLRRYEALAPRPAATRGWRQALQDSHRFTTFERLEVPHRQRFCHPRRSRRPVRVDQPCDAPRSGDPPASLRRPAHHRGRPGPRGDHHEHGHRGRLGGMNLP
jgi:SAM-dependent methyltransferase